MRLVLLGRSMLNASDQSDFGYCSLDRSDAEHGELARLSHSIPLLPKRLTDALNRTGKIRFSATIKPVNKKAGFT